MHKLIKKIWKKQEMPQEWSTSIIVPLHKRGDKVVWTNYRRVSLLNVGYKILARIINNRLKQYAESLVGGYKCRFPEGRATTEQMFTLRLIMEKFYKYNMTILQLYIGFKEAYDSENRGQLFLAMSKLTVPRN